MAGKVSADEPLNANQLIVNLIDPNTHTPPARAFVGADGSFTFHHVAAGAYSVELVAQNGNPILRETIRLNSPGDQIELRLPARENRPGAVTGTVSVRQLQHPLSSKSKRAIEQAQKASDKGEFLKAIEILRGTLNDGSAVPYARMNIGVAYLRAGQAAAAVPELQEAVRLMPEDAAGRTNLAYALLYTRRMEEAETECRRALLLDKNNSKARWVMGSILLAQGSHVEEAVEDLRFASREIPKARVTLAQFYERSGQKDAAARELRAFLPQASDVERVTVEKWLSKLAVK